MRSLEFSIGEFYHIYNRGTDKRKIFLNPKDYDRFIALLYLCNSTDSVHISLQGRSLKDLLSIKQSKKLVDIGAYCLMPNHFHILLREREKNGISSFMHKLSTGYTMYFNKKNNRSGNLFQGVFKATHVNTDRYLKYLFSYIHLNPIKLIQSDWEKSGIKDAKSAEQFLQSYKYSSYDEYTNLNRLQKVILEKEAFPDYFENKESFQTMLKFWLDFSKDPDSIKSKI